MNTLYIAVGCITRYESVFARVCPYSRVVEMAVIEAGIPANILLINLSQKPKWFTKLSTGSAPNAYWNGTWHSESAHILDEVLPMLFPDQYQSIDQHLPCVGFAPLDQAGQGMALFNAADKVGIAVMVAKKNDPLREEKQQTLLDQLRALEAVLEANRTMQNDDPTRSLHSVFLSGLPTPSIADIALVCSIWRIVVVTVGHFQNFDLADQGFPLLAQWILAFKERPSFTRTIPDYFEPFLIYFNCKFYADIEDPENSAMRMTPEIERNHHEANELSRQRTKDLAELDENNSRCKLLRCETVLKTLERALVHGGSKPYLCGDSIGLADVVVFSHVKFLWDVCSVIHAQLDFVERGFPRTDAYVNTITAKVRFKLLNSKLVPRLMRLHLSDRFATSRPHLVLSPSEREALKSEINDMKAVAGFPSNERAREIPSARAFSPRSSVDSRSMSEKKEEVEDLLFCI